MLISQIEELGLKERGCVNVSTEAADVVTKGHSNKIPVLCAICKRPTQTQKQRDMKRHEY